MESVFKRKDVKKYIMVSIYNIEDTGLFGVYGYVDNYSIYKDCKYIDSVEQSISNIYEIK